MSLGRKIILVICIIVFVGAAGVLLNYFITGMREQQALEDLEKLKTDREDLKTDKGTVIGKYVDLYLMNGDIIGWLEIEGTKVNYPVMWTPNDPEFYLRRNFNKEHATSGTLFLDAASDIFIPTSNFFIYGHNMKNGTMFGELKNYLDEEFRLAHPVMEFQTADGVEQYTVFAVAAVQKTDAWYSFIDASGSEDFTEQTAAILQKSLYDTGAAPVFGQQIITLSTCYGSSKDGRLLVIGVKQ